jgi:glycine/D-amino acid oxidase-like deaminating enzyme
MLMNGKSAKVIEGDYWLSTSGDDLGLRPSLTRDEVVDVAILGGGFSGLWTAWHLLRNAPELRVAIIERRFCGFGASGRNGGWCSPRFPVDTSLLAKQFGADVARATIKAQGMAVEEIGRICEEEGIDAHYRATGLLSIARGDAQRRSIEGTYRTYEALGLGEGNRLLSREEAYDRVHIAGLSGGLESSAGANVHPGRLVRGLARAVERRGGVIYEGTEAIRLVPGADAMIETKGGTLRARKAIVAAGEAYLTEQPGFRRALLPMSSMIVLTEPLSEEQWRAVGWESGASLSSQVHTKDYLTRTLDGRILYGSRGAPYLFGSRMSEQALREEQTYARMRETVREWWPALGDIAFTHAWGGYLGIPRDWMPTVDYDPATKLGQLRGYTGRGVSTSAMCAKLLAGLIGGWKSGLESLPMHRPGARAWEPEPFRWMGVRYVQNAFQRLDEAELTGRPRPFDSRLAAYLGEQ